MSYYTAGLGAMMFDKQLARVDEMRKDTLERVDKTAKGVGVAVLAGAVISAISTAVLVRSAYKMRKGA